MRVVPYSEIYDDDPEGEGVQELQERRPSREDSRMFDGPGLFEESTGIYDAEVEGWQAAPRRPPSLDASGASAASGMPGAPSDRLDVIVQRAVGEQLAEQRMVRTGLSDMDERLRMLERSVSERLGELEGEVVGRLSDFERSVTDRMLAFETVLERLVDRLGAAETRIVEGLDHNDRMTRAQLDALRPSLEAAFERVMDLVERTSVGGAPVIEPLVAPEPPPGLTAEEVDAVVAKAMKSATTSLSRKIEAAADRLLAAVEPVPGELVPAEVVPAEVVPVVVADSGVHIDAEPVAAAAPAKPPKKQQKQKRQRPLRAR